jgi:CHAT domain-containing protein
MTIRPAREHGNRQPPCLKDEDFYHYCTGSSSGRSSEEIELHLAECRRCREELAGLIEILHPKPAEITERVHDASPQEIQKVLAVFQDASPRVPIRSSNPAKWFRWGAAAAAVIIAIGLSTAGLLYLYEKKKSEDFCVQARSLLERMYAPQSPSDLRLDLPFRSGVSQRAPSSEEDLESAERLFNRALGIRDGLREALLGLGYVQLRKNQFGEAREEFQRVLNSDGTDVQALLGRGVGSFEAGMASLDPTVRSASLGDALEDFEKALTLKPESQEARYNKIQALYEMGRHRLALQEIDAYLARETDSLWAIKLGNLKTRILMNRAEFIKSEIQHAARARDAPALESLVRIAPYKIPPIIRSLLLDTLARTGQTDTTVVATSAELQWAAEVLAAAYRGATGDESHTRLLDFYATLSPTKVQAKRDLDTSLERLIALFAKGDIESSYRDTAPLIREFEKLGDHWQLVRVYQLRGTAQFYGKADFIAATDEFLKMLGAAERSSDPDLIARSLGALASSYNDRQQYDKALACLSRLKRLAELHHMEDWKAFAYKSQGTAYFRLNQLDESLREYSSALALAYRLMDPQALVVALENLGAVMERMGRLQEARSFYGEAGKCQDALLKDGMLQSIPDVEARRLNLLSMQGYLALRMNDLTAAEARFMGALKPPLGGMRELEAKNRMGLAQVYLAQNRLQEAQAEANKILGITAHSAFPEIAWQVQGLEGFLSKSAGDHAGALLHFQRATEILERMRENISSADLRHSFFTRRYDPYRETVALLFHMKKSPTLILEFADRAKSMTLREYLETSAEPAIKRRQRRASWSRHAGISEPLPPGIVTLEYFLTSDQLFAFVSGSHGTEAVSLNVPSSELESTVEKYLESIKTNDRDSFAALSLSLYQTLIAPLLPKLESADVRTLVILPDGVLHLLPFVSLMDSSGHYLLEKFAVSYAPSRSVLNYCLSIHKAKQLTPENSILLMDGTSNLTGASQELAHLAGLYATSNRRVTSADISSLGSCVNGYEIIHFSGHASIQSGRPRLVFQDPRGPTYLECSMIEGWRLRNNRLVSLAGCATGIGPIFDGEMPWGLVPAFLNAGAPALLVSLLPVDDTGTRRLTEQFYELLARGGVSKAGALRQAQLSFLKDPAILAHSGPICWTPFVIIGDPR